MLKLLISSLVVTLAVAAPLEPRQTTPFATGIIVPIYFDPGSTGCYPEVVATYNAYPATPFTLILNPDSGYSDPTTSDLLKCIPALRRTMPTAKLIGYIPTGYGNAAKTRFVNNQIGSWAGLKNTRVGGVDGVFFDEVLGNRASLSLYTAYSNTVKRAFGPTAFITLNPGLPILVGYYSLANLIVTYEDSYANFNATTFFAPPAIRTTTAMLVQQVAIVHTIPIRAESTVTQSLIDTLVPKIGAVYLTDLSGVGDNNPYESLGAGFGAFATDLGRKQSGRTPAVRPSA